MEFDLDGLFITILLIAGIGYLVGFCVGYISGNNRGSASIKIRSKGK